MGDVRVSAMDEARQFARYLENWTSMEDSEVTPHEIASMRTAGQELHRFLDGIEAERTAPTVKVTMNLAGDTPEFREALRKVIRRDGGPGMSWAAR